MEVNRYLRLFNQTLLNNNYSRTQTIIISNLVMVVTLIGFNPVMCVVV